MCFSGWFKGKAIEDEITSPGRSFVLPGGLLDRKGIRGENGDGGEVRRGGWRGEGEGEIKGKGGDCCVGWD